MFLVIPRTAETAEPGAHQFRLPAQPCDPLEGQCGDGLPEPSVCTPPTPEPGSARPWESAIPVAPYSQVNTRTGNLLTAIPIVEWSGTGPEMSMWLFHNSANVDTDLDLTSYVGFDLGPGWSIAYSDQIIFDDPTTPSVAIVFHEDGTQDVHTWNGTGWDAPTGVFDRLEQDASNPFTWRLWHKDQSRHEFTVVLQPNVARLSKIVDALGNETELFYDLSVVPNRLERIEANGRTLHLQFDENGRLEKFVDPADSLEPDCKDGEPGANPSIGDREWQLVYIESGSDSGRLDYVRDYEGRNIFFTWDANGRLATITDKTGTASGDTYSFGYYADGRLDTVTDPLFTQQRFESDCVDDRIWSEYFDRRGNVWTYFYNNDPTRNLYPDGNLDRVRSPDQFFATTGYTYDDDRNRTSSTDEIGIGWDATYDANGNLLTITDDLGHVRTWTYDLLNNVTSYTDAMDNTVTFAFGEPPSTNPTLLTSITEPPDGMGLPQVVTRLEYDQSGNLTRVVDPNGVVTRFEYILGQLSRYVEGELQGQDVYWQHLEYDSGSRLARTWTSYEPQGGGGTCWGSPPSSSTCFDAAVLLREDPDPAPDFPHLPCGGPDMSALVMKAQFDGAVYSAKDELLTMPLWLQRGNINVGDRDFEYEYDKLGRTTLDKITSTEGGLPSRTFSYGYDEPVPADGSFKTTRHGVGGSVTITYDAANRVERYVRGPFPDPEVDPTMSADYEYLANGLLARVLFGNGTRIVYDYDRAMRLTSIDHQNVTGGTMLKMSYAYLDNDLPAEIVETGLAGATIATTTYGYDTRGRLVSEQRIGTNAYHLEYVYDQGGNRLEKRDLLAQTRVEYYYDYQNPILYESNNNRLMYAMTWDTSQATPVLLSTDYYYYTAAGNVSRIITKNEPVVVAAMGATGGLPTSADSGGMAKRRAAMYEPRAQSERSKGGVAVSTCDLGTEEYTSVAFEYAKNGEAVTYALGESWCSDGSIASCNNYELLWAKEFRYDNARARYLVNELDTGLLLSGIVSVTAQNASSYDGDDIVRDAFAHYEPGLARVMPPFTTNGGQDTMYYHNDHLGTTRLMTDASGKAATGWYDPAGTSDDVTPSVFTAFGEPITGPLNGSSDRYGYVGGHGYQAHDEMPLLHVGARYYDPTSGRFLQRDPIGISSGGNVYAYVGGVPTVGTDPSGLTYLINPVVFPTGSDIARGLNDIFDGIGRGADWLDRQLDSLINGHSAAGAGAGVGVGMAANYKWRLGIGKIVNRATSALAGTYIGWNGGKLLNRNIVRPAQDVWFRLMQRLIQQGPPGYPLPKNQGKRRNGGRSVLMCS